MKIRPSPKSWLEYHPSFSSIQRQRSAASWKVLIVLVLMLLSALPAAADGVLAWLDGRTVVRRDADTGAKLSSIMVGNALAVGCDGKTIAVLKDGGLLVRYNARSGSRLGSTMVGSDARNVQVSSGVILVMSDGWVKRYKADTGAMIGSSFR